MSQSNLAKQLNHLWETGVQTTSRTASLEVLQAKFTETTKAMLQSIGADTSLTFEQLQIKTQGKRWSFESFCQQVKRYGAQVSTET
jgi:hypothetical protein